MSYSTKILQIVIVLCLFSLIFADIHRIVLKRERGRTRNHKKRYIREHGRKKSNNRSRVHYSPTYISHIEDVPGPMPQHDFSNYYQQSIYGNAHKEGGNNWDSFTESSEPYYKKYTQNYASSFPMDSFNKQQQNIADLIDFTTSSPQRIPASLLNNNGDYYSTLQSTESPLEYIKNHDTNQLLQQTSKKRKKNYGNYEVFETTDDNSHSGPTDTYQKNYSPTLDTSKYVHYSTSSENLRSHHHTSSSSNYGKRKKNKKSRRSH